MKKKKVEKRRLNEPRPKKMMLFGISMTVSLIIALIFFYFSKSWITSVVSLVISESLLLFYLVARENLKKYQKIKKMELVFPDFLQLMSSNLRAGMTTDRALLLSSRKEFAPLDYEINQLGKDLVTGRQIDFALKDMAKRIGSRKIEKTTELIISGIRSGGDIAVLLEQTSTNMRERNFIEKKSASNVLMYVIFIFFAIAAGSPILFGLSSVLVEVLTGILSNLPAIESSIALPFTLTSVNISISFINYYSVIFLIATDILGALVIGQVVKGKEKEGIKYIIPLIAISLVLFFVVKKFLAGYFAGLVG